MSLEMYKWFEKNNRGKKRFKEKYGRKPTKEEIKLIRKGRIDLGPAPRREHLSINEAIMVRNHGGKPNKDGI